ncbi:MAG: uracil phosphoribosyltransferase [Candidatus Kapaibacterium sp.]
MIKVLDHPLVMHYLTVARNKKTSMQEFRHALSKIGLHLAIEAYRDLELDDTLVESDAEISRGHRIISEIILTPLLRGGIALLDSFRSIYPNSEIGMIGVRKNPASKESTEYIYSMPEPIDDPAVVLLDITISSGGNLSAAIARLQLEGFRKITVCSVASSPEGVERLCSEYPELKVITASFERELGENGRLLPGLGDATDRYMSHFTDS